MHKYIRRWQVYWPAIALLMLPSVAVKAEELHDIQLTLPAHIYAAAGTEMSVYWVNTLLAENPAKFSFQVKCDVGKQEDSRWHLAAKAGDVGEHKFSLSVKNAGGELLASANSTLIVAPAEAGNESQVRLLIVGDSLTHASHYPNKIAELLGLPGNPTFTMLGTHKPKGVAAGVAHEGYGGWTWQRFVEHYEPKPDGTHRKKSSPFVFLNDKGNPELNVQRYIDEQCDGEPPNVIVIKLGINDCFRVDPSSTEAIDNQIDTVFGHADRLVAAFRKVAPDAIIGICLTTPGNARDIAFEANYGDRYTRWGWKRIQHRLVQRQLEHFAGREQENISVIPTQLNLDTRDGYPEKNGVHPNKTGYNQIGATIYAWLKHHLNGEK